MNKVIRIISILLLGAAAAAMFLWNTAVIKGATISQIAFSNKVVPFALPGLLLVSGIICFRSWGFKNLRILRIIIGALGIAVALLPTFLPPMQMNKGDVVIDLKIAIIGISYVAVFLLLFFVHFIEIFRRKGVSKVFIFLADLVMMVLLFAHFGVLAVPAVTQIPQYSYFELVFQYAHYAVGGVLALVFVLAVLELFLRKPAK